MRHMVIDDREVTQHEDIPSKIGVPLEVERLDSADYAFMDVNGNSIGIERSEIGNLLQKLRSGDLESQIRRCADTYNSVVLLVEGVYDEVDDLLAVYRGGSKGYFRSRVFPTTTYESVMSLLARFSDLGIEVIQSPNFDCSLRIIRCIFNQRTKGVDEHSLFRKIRTVRLPAKMTNNPAVPMLMYLCPRLSERAAIRLIHRFGSIWGVVNAPEKELLEVEGFGKSLLRRLLDNVGKN